MDALVKVALVGTAKHPALPLDPAHDADALLMEQDALSRAREQADTAQQSPRHTPQPADAEQQLLLRAGAWSLVQQAGLQPRTDVARLPPAPPAAPLSLTPRGIEVLQQSFATEKHELLIEFLHALHEANVDLPHGLLPLALGQSDQELRTALLPVLGERGRWLSQFNPAWTWVAHGAQTLSTQDQTALQRAWDEGNLLQRRVALAVLRRSDPDLARGWLEAALPQEKAEHRVELVKQLRVGLSLADEPLLERLLDDRSEQVRAQAIPLLRTLPASAYALRMRSRAEALLHRDPRARTFKLQCTPPEEIAKDWHRDGVPAKTPAGRGKRAYWTELVLTAVPPSHWVQHFERSPAELVEVVRETDFAEEVLLGWTRAVSGFGEPDPAWAEALWEPALAPLRKKKASLLQDEIDRLTALLRAMPAPAAEQQVEPFLAGDAPHPEALLELLEALPRPWSPRFTAVYLDRARSTVDSGLIDRAYEWTKSLAAAARALPRSAFAAALQPWTVLRPEQSWTAAAVQQEVQRFRHLVHLRQAFYEELHLVRNSD